MIYNIEMSKTKKRPKIYGSYNADDGSIKCNLLDPNWAYFMGLLHTDGHMRKDKKTPNGGSIIINLKHSDASILKRLRFLFGGSVLHRYEKTNFSKNKLYHSVRLLIYRFPIRNELLQNGMPYGAKSKTINPPTKSYSEADYWRGVIDGDGSLGMNNLNKPYISLEVASKDIILAFNEYVKKTIGKTTISNLNKKKMYASKLNVEDAQKLVSILYYPGCLGITRKIRRAKKVLAWKRPPNMIMKSPPWPAKDDKTLIKKSLEDACKAFPHRTRIAIRNRRNRLLREIKKAH